MHMSNMPQIPPQALGDDEGPSHAAFQSGEPITTQICMTQEQVNADKPPAMSNRDESCDTKVADQSPG